MAIIKEREIQEMREEEEKEKELENLPENEKNKKMMEFKQEQGIGSENNEWTKRKEDLDRKLKSIKDKEIDVFVPNYIRNEYEQWNNDVDWPSLGKAPSDNSGGGAHLPQVKI